MMSEKAQLPNINASCSSHSSGLEKWIAKTVDGRLLVYPCRLSNNPESLSLSIDLENKKVYNHHQPYGDLKALDINENQVSLTIKFASTDLHPEDIDQQMSFFTDDIEWLNDLNNEYAKAE